MLKLISLKVASFTDAWIETSARLARSLLAYVASFTDAWIETFTVNNRRAYPKVASFTDAWIETYFRSREQYLKSSHLLQMRGLKLLMIFVMSMLISVASFTDAWIETA